MAHTRLYRWTDCAALLATRTVWCPLLRLVLGMLDFWCTSHQGSQGTSLEAPLPWQGCSLRMWQPGVPVAAVPWAAMGGAIGGAVGGGIIPDGMVAGVIGVTCPVGINAGPNSDSFSCTVGICKDSIRWATALIFSCRRSMASSSWSISPLFHSQPSSLHFLSWHHWGCGPETILNVSSAFDTRHRQLRPFLCCNWLRPSATPLLGSCSSLQWRQFPNCDINLVGAFESCWWVSPTSRWSSSTPQSLR